MNSTEKDGEKIGFANNDPMKDLEVIDEIDGSTNTENTQQSKVEPK